MSTKIYNGLRIDLPAADLFAFTAELRALCAPIRDRREAELTAAHAAEVVDLAWAVEAGLAPDHATATLAEITAVPVVHAFRAIAERRRQIRATGLRDPGVDTGLDVSFLRDPDTGTILAIPYTEVRAYLDALRTHPAVTPYGYWNNTDRPDDVTAAHWEARRAAWERCAGADPVAVRALTWTLDDATCGLDAAAIRAHLPSVTARAGNLAVHVHTGEVSLRALEATRARLERHLPALDPDALFADVPRVATPTSR